MKKIIFIFSIVLMGVVIFSFRSIDSEIDEVKITVTAEKETLFDMFASPSLERFENSKPDFVKSKKGLKTPYEFKVNSSAYFIFKSQDQKTRIKVKAERKGGRVTEELPIVVILLEGEKMATFGID